jgi:hypothetical protein
VLQSEHQFYQNQIGLPALLARRRRLLPLQARATRIGRRHCNEPDHPCWPAVWYAITEFVRVNCAIRDLESAGSVQR